MRLVYIYILMKYLYKDVVFIVYTYSSNGCHFIILLYAFKLALLASL